MEKLPHQDFEWLLLSRKQTQYVLGGVSLKVIKDLEKNGDLTPVRLNRRSATSQVFYRVAQVRLLAEGGRP